MHLLGHNETKQVKIKTSKASYSLIEKWQQQQEKKTSSILRQNKNVFIFPLNSLST
jgi:hypothetical protein